MADLLGFNNIISDLLNFFITATTNEILFFVKTTLKGFIHFLFDSLRYVEDFVKHLERLFKR